MKYRINQYLAKHLSLSRRKAEDYIIQGRVKTNGKFAVLTTQVMKGDTVEVFFEGGWRLLSYCEIENNQTILFYKPPFTLTAKKRDGGKRTIYDCLPKIYRSLKPAGRLDYLSEGLLVLSSDGLLINKLTHPKYGHTKTYLVNIDKKFTESERKKLEEGVVLDNYKLQPTKITYASDITLKNYSYLQLSLKGYWYLFQLDEGRNNQIRKMCKSGGKKVNRLIRVEQGPHQITRPLYEQGVLEISQPH
jgi:23S rRNA pseudouridine2605 synthase